MIKLSELNPKGFALSAEVEAELNKLCVALNVVRAAYGKPMVVTSGYRSLDDHKRIYAEKNAARAKQGLKPLHVPTASKHLYGQAVDISDPGGHLWRWLQANQTVLEKAGLWCETRQGNWQHFQTLPPGSGKRWFNP
jgi:uncharacterized protein YcbK (DUF882 family)